jgi:hypothetical protein
MADRQEHQPGAHAPVAGQYEELNVFGTPTGKVAHVREGERLPRAPRGFSWRQIDEPEGLATVLCRSDSQERRDVDAGEPTSV